MNELARGLTTPWHALLSLCLAPGMAVASTEWLYGVRLQPGCCQWLERIDLQSGQATPGSSVASQSPVPHGLTYRGDRLLSVSQAWNPDRLVVYHLANGDQVQPGTTGLNNTTVALSLERDPTTDVVYYGDFYDLYTLDPSTGTATLVAPFTGFNFVGDGIQSMAIDAGGHALAIAWDSGSTYHSVYSVELSTAVLTWIGDLTIPNAHGWYRDLAFSSSGELWASFYDIGLNPAARGLYKIDTTSPFGGGTRCIASPWRRTLVLDSGGTPAPAADCSGGWQLDFNTWMWQHGALPPGLTLQVQWLGRDPGFAPPDAWTLSDALEFTLRL